MAARAQEALGWHVGVVARSFPDRTFFEAIELTASLGLRLIEGFSDQKVSADIPRSLNYNLSEVEREAVTQKLRSAGMTMPVYSVGRMPSDDESCSRVFQFARSLGVETIVCESAPEAISMMERLCEKYGVNVAFHEQITDASGVARALEDIARDYQGRSRRVGVCGELGEWMRAGIKPIEVLPILKDRLLVIHVHDLNQFGSDGHDVAWGTGVAGLEEFIKEAYRLELKPTLWTVEYPPGREEALAEIARAIEFFNKTIIPIAEYHRNYVARTAGVRRLAGVSPEERQKIEQAIPETAPAVPAKPRKLLVMDLNVGRHGHPSIPHANLAVELMGKKTGAYEAVFSNDRAILQPDNLRQFDAVFLDNTIGPIFDTAELRASFRAFIHNGGGLVANHAVTVTSEDWPEFGEILGARGAFHRDADEKVVIKLDDPNSSVNAAFGSKSFEFRDEIFRFAAPYSRQKVHVLVSIDVDRTDMNQGTPRGNCFREDNDYAISWIRQYGKGRVFYCSLGHNPYVFWDPMILKHFLAGIQFALGDLPADATPSASQADGRNAR
ncbi:MAG: ThuA domain-containing protein [bacterium]|nr:ThuA domain-containing protein [bacterium]